VTALVGISASFHDFGDYGAVGVPRPLAVPAVQWEFQEEWRLDPRFLGVLRWFAAVCAGQLAGSHDASTM
jgi:hypothetical protein